jgi:UDP-N-acetylmuramyl pentapeptide phosphotransferase/UDP-N-acetylglucosamine-1-phosphate transferase
MAFSAMNVCISAAALAFLTLNFHPARIFMGDSGSIPLGFLAATFGVVGWIKGLWPVWFPVLVFAPFIMDASVTLVKRVFTGEKVWDAHRSHYYQRLVLMGWGHGRTALTEYALMITSGVTAIWMLHKPIDIQFLCLSVWGMIYGVLILWIDVLWNQFQKLQQNKTVSTI